MSKLGPRLWPRGHIHKLHLQFVPSPEFPPIALFPPGELNLDLDARSGVVRFGILNVPRYSILGLPFSVLTKVRYGRRRLRPNIENGFLKTRRAKLNGKYIEQYRCSMTCCRKDTQLPVTAAASISMSAFRGVFENTRSKSKMWLQNSL